MVQKKSRVVNIRWKAWYGDNILNLFFPEKWNVTEYSIRGGEAITTEKEIRERFFKPIGSPPLFQLAKGKKTVAILVDDLTRPTKAYKFIPVILSQLKEGGITKKNIRIIISLGSHRPLVKTDLQKKLGRKVLEEIEVYNHYPYENLVDLGTLEGKIPVLVNKMFMDCDLKIGIGSIIPHSTAGFSGGGKIIIPGVCGMKTIESSHKPFYDGPTSIASVEKTHIRKIIEQVVKRTDLKFIVNTIVNSNRDPVGLFVGDPIEAHREGVAFARKVYATRIPQMVDVAIFNAYPKDTELSLNDSAFNFYWSCRQEIVKPGGIIIIITASSEGFGYHGLGDPGMRGYRRVDEISFSKKLFKEKRVFILSPNINYPDIRKIFPEGTILFKNWYSLLAELLSVYKDKCSIAVFPCGPLQISDVH